MYSRWALVKIIYECLLVFLISLAKSRPDILDFKSISNKSTFTTFSLTYWSVSSGDVEEKAISASKLCFIKSASNILHSLSKIDLLSSHRAKLNIYNNPPHKINL